MEGLTIKVFRTYHASILFQNQLKKNTPTDGSVNEKILVYNRANREVAILLNHQQAIKKNFDSQMNKIENEVKRVHCFYHIYFIYKIKLLLTLIHYYL